MFSETFDVYRELINGIQKQYVNGRKKYTWRYERKRGMGNLTFAIKLKHAMHP